MGFYGQTLTRTYFSARVWWMLNTTRITSTTLGTTSATSAYSGLQWTRSATYLLSRATPGGFATYSGGYYLGGQITSGSGLLGGGFGSVPVIYTTAFSTLPTSGIISTYVVNYSLYYKAGASGLSLYYLYWRTQDDINNNHKSDTYEGLFNNGGIPPISNDLDGAPGNGGF